MTLRSMCISLALGSLVTLAVACSDDARPPAVGASSGQQASSSGASSGAAADASVDAPVDSGVGPQLCENIEEPAQGVAEYETIFPPPKPAGGPIQPGVYLLDEVKVYKPDLTLNDPEAAPEQATSNLFKSTLIVTRTTLQFLEAKGKEDGEGGMFDPSVSRAFTFKVQGNNLELSPVCPASAQSGVVGYTQRNFGITLFDAKGDYRSYRIKP